MKVLITTYRYGSPRLPGEGIRIGTARQVPRGIRREDWQRRHYFDLRIPLVAPTMDLVSKYKHGKISFAVFGRHYKTQMQKPESRQVIELLASIALFQPVSIGCFCEDESHCHRSLLREMIVREAKKKAAGYSRLRQSASSEASARFASPVCYADEHE